MHRSLLMAPDSVAFARYAPRPRRYRTSNSALTSSNAGRGRRFFSQLPHRSSSRRVPLTVSAALPAATYSSMYWSTNRSHRFI